MKRFVNNVNRFNSLSIQNGTLSVEELKKLSQCIRDIEQNKPIRHLNIWMDVPDKTINQIQEVNDSIVPGFPIKGVIEFNKGKKWRVYGENEKISWEKNRTNKTRKKLPTKNITKSNFDVKL